MSETKPVLYSYWRSSCSWRVRIVLAFKEIEYELKTVHLVKDGGQQRKDEYASINAMMQVPSLNWEGNLINDSVAIMEFLEEIHPNSPLLPKDYFKRAHLIVSGTQPLQNLTVLQYVGDEKKMQWGKHWIHRAFVVPSMQRMLENLHFEMIDCHGREKISLPWRSIILKCKYSYMCCMLGTWGFKKWYKTNGVTDSKYVNLFMDYKMHTHQIQRHEHEIIYRSGRRDTLEKKLHVCSGKYCMGDELSLADCCVVPQVYNAIRFKIDMSEFPTIKRINDSLVELECFKKADPKVQIDCPEEERT